MIADRAALVEKIDAMIDNGFRDGEYTLKNLLAAAIPLIRNEALEEAARAANEAWLDGVPVAEIPAAIRALKGGT